MPNRSDVCMVFEFLGGNLLIRMKYMGCHGISLKLICGYMLIILDYLHNVLFDPFQFWELQCVCEQEGQRYPEICGILHKGVLELAADNRCDIQKFSVVLQKQLFQLMFTCTEVLAILFKRYMQVSTDHAIKYAQAGTCQRPEKSPLQDPLLFQLVRRLFMWCLMANAIVPGLYQDVILHSTPTSSFTPPSDSSRPAATAMTCPNPSRTNRRF